MPTNVVMPQMGESVAEGTIVRWLKKVGERVDRDEPLFEISTDKVDAEIPSPAAGVLADIKAREGETVPVEAVVAVIAEPGTVVTGRPAAETPAAAAATAPAPSVAATPAPRPPVAAPPSAQPAVAVPAPQAPVAAPVGAPPQPAPSNLPAETTAHDRRLARSSPLVRKIARENQVDLAAVSGTGVGGRVTKHDILGYIERGGAQPAAASPVPAGQVPPAAAVSGPGAAPARVPVFRPGEAVEIVPMSVMRKRIAEHMIMSRRTSAHVHSFFEIDFQNVAAIRQAKKADYEKLGVKLTYLPFIIKAATDALRAVPVVNSSIDGDSIVYKKDINIGIAVALDWGLIVPVVKRADELNILGLSRAVADLASRARSRQLKPEEVQGGTFSITNPGVFGALAGTPIISQPQVAILGIGHIEKRPVVIDDMIAIRLRGYMSLGYDHRIVDGAIADEFMSIVKQRIETFDPSAV